MLHTKSQGHWPFGSRKEDIKRVFTIYGHGGHLGHVSSIGQVVFEETMFFDVLMELKYERPWLKS